MIDATQGRAIASEDDPFGLFKDILFRPRLFFAEADEEQLAVGANAGVISAILGLFGMTIVNFALSYAASRPTGFVDAAPVWSLPVALAAIVVAFFVQFGLSLLLVRLMKGKGRIREDVLVFGCSLAPSPLAVIPFFGLPIAGVYQAVIFGFGLKRAEKVSTGKALFAAMLPLPLMLATALAMSTLLLAVIGSS